MIAVWLALLASASWGVADFLGGLTSRRESVFKVLAISQPAGLLLITIALLLHGHGVALGSNALWAAGAGVASVGSLGCLYFAMAKGDMILVAPLAATGVVIPVIAGIVSGNSITSVTATGMLLAVIGSIATTWSAPEPATDRADSRVNLVAALFALGSAAGQGLFLLMLSHATNGDAYSATWIMRVVSCAVTLVAYFGYRRRLVRPAPALAVAAPAMVPAGSVATATTADPPSRPLPEPADRLLVAPSRRWRQMAALLAIPAVGIADATAEISFAGATINGPLSTAAVLSSLYPVGTMLLAMILLRERARAVQGLGAACALVGVVLLSSA